MKNQFIYTRTTEEGNSFKDSFNVNKVIRSVTLPQGDVLVVLDDFNEQVQNVPDIDPKTNKMKGMKNVRQSVHSEIQLSPADGERFFNLLNIEG